MRGTLATCLLLLLSASACAGTYQCSISESERGYLEADWARNPAFGTKKLYIQNQLDTALARLRNNQQLGANYRAQLAAKIAEPTAQTVQCDVLPADETLLDTLMPLIPTRQGKIHMLLWSQITQVRDGVQRSDLSKMADAGRQCTDIPGKIFSVTRNVATQVLEWSCK